MRIYEDRPKTLRQVAEKVDPIEVSRKHPDDAVISGGSYFVDGQLLGSVASISWEMHWKVEKKRKLLVHRQAIVEYFPTGLKKGKK